MKIFCVPREKEELQIEINENTLTCIYKKWRKSWNLPALFDKHKLTSDNLSLQVWATTKGFIEPFHPTPTRLDFPVDLLKKSGEAIDNQLFYIMFNGRNECCICSRTFKIKSDSADVVVCEGSPFEQAVKLYPGFAVNSRNYDKKRKLLFKLDCNDSLSGNEKQVDILTKIVKVLARHYADEIAEELPEYAEFFEAVEETGALTQDTVSECIENMRKHKQFIRNAVEEYRDDKDK